MKKLYKISMYPADDTDVAADTLREAIDKFLEYYNAAYKFEKSEDDIESIIKLNDRVVG